MRNKNLKYFLLAIFSGLVVMVAMSVLGYESKEARPPIILPISLKQSGNIVDAKISIVDHHVYYFSLRFSYRENDQADRARVKRLVGSHEVKRDGKPLNPGVSVPVCISVSLIENSKETEIFSKEIDPILTSWGGDNFKKQIGFTELKPGSYVVRVALLQSAPDFEGTPVSFGIGYDKFKTNFIPQKK